MKINYVDREEDVELWRELEAGETFLFDDKVYLVIGARKTVSKINEDTEFYAVSLDEAQLGVFSRCSSEQVKKVLCTVMVTNDEE